MVDRLIATWILGLESALTGRIRLADIVPAVTKSLAITVFFTIPPVAFTAFVVHYASAPRRYLVYVALPIVVLWALTVVPYYIELERTNGQ